MDSGRCKFCCKPIVEADTRRMASGTIPPVDRAVEIFRKYPPRSVPTIVRTGKVFEVYRWKCNNIPGQECCSCCRPEDVLLPHELSDAETKQMVSGLVVMAE